MKIFTIEKIREADKFTIINQPISSISLMERASSACVEWIIEHCKNHTKFSIFCGSGNNGGDGFAIARLLYLKGFDINVFIDKENSKFSDDAMINYKRLKEFSGISVQDFKHSESFEFDEQTVIIDALFGTGLSRKLDRTYKELIEKLNKLSQVKISIDVPSGLFADEILEENQTIFIADYTLSFQFWKRSFLHPETGKFTGKVVILDIDLSKEFINKTATDYVVTDDETIKGIFKPRSDFAHKGSHGKAIIVAGSYGKIGAAVLATQAAMKTGAGLTLTIAPNCGYEILQTTCPEAMFISGGENFIKEIEIQKDSVYGIGPGLGTDLQTEKALLDFLKHSQNPVLLDADALNLISRNQDIISLIPKNSVITPHPKEFERLFGKTEDSFQRLELARIKAKELKIHIVLKDHHTQIITPEGKVFYNITGNSGLAKGGSGDVLTGIITSLLAQQYSAKNACILGVWLHGKAADFSAEKFSKEAMLPSNVIDELGNVFLLLNKKATT
ncbi:Bifunctional NAD(P)H-hydrate repair enzyme Nnr [Chryseobacterium aquaeductus]|uniref:Bifunctional NAD(P)H-hydrate repair enzyme n=1 Tax=Chryseobacterium aquaeductus TaxID=2675056 RepID=A0A9N8QQL9_9FLAO|nr:NAD(P)H-hydrate dehydratase [Chryseobacterium aquaeductus]CAA7329365.1 Bifunctional NAD(P)H-hydrate repair enzyme Nnr [Chryseobacterium potabilaquae]CAD7796448.1 Bifunctional NAD(P)H-hydrate repair enzyme Nnr [Chryseobacterium aquaeductus]